MVACPSCNNIKCFADAKKKHYGVWFINTHSTLLKKDKKFVIDEMFYKRGHIVIRKLPCNSQ